MYGLFRAVGAQSLREDHPVRLALGIGNILVRGTRFWVVTAALFAIAVFTLARAMHVGAETPTGIHRTKKTPTTTSGGTANRNWRRRKAE